MASKQDKPSEPHPKNALEWTVFGISLLLLLSLLSYLVFQATSARTSASPDITVEYRPEPSRHNPYRYRIIVHNQGGETAEGVLLEFALLRAGEVREKADLEIAFLPKQSKREGWVNFSMDPTTADSVVARVVSYKKP